MAVSYTGVARCIRLPYVPKRVLREICEFANDEGLAVVPIGTLCRVIGYSRRTVQKHISAFCRTAVHEDLGVLKISGCDIESTVYRVDLDEAIEVYGIVPGLECLLPSHCWAGGSGAAFAPQGQNTGGAS